MENRWTKTPIDQRFYLHVLFHARLISINNLRWLELNHTATFCIPTVGSRLIWDEIFVDSRGKQRLTWLQAGPSWFISGRLPRWIQQQAMLAMYNRADCRHQRSAMPTCRGRRQVRSQVLADRIEPSAGRFQDDGSIRRYLTLIVPVRSSKSTENEWLTRTGRFSLNLAVFLNDAEAEKVSVRILQHNKVIARSVPPGIARRANLD